MGLSERFGKWDEEHVVYRADDPEQELAWRGYWWIWIATRLVTIAFIVGLSAIVGTFVAIYVTLALCLVFLVFYLVWRRRRNMRLTGSPTTLPKPKAE